VLELESVERLIMVDPMNDYSEERKEEFLEFFNLDSNFIKAIDSKYSVELDKYKLEFLHKCYFNKMKNKDDIFNSYCNASVYYALRHLYGRPEKFKSEQKLVEFLKNNLKEGSDILDYGCDVGDFSILFSRLGYNVTVCDLDTALLDFAEFRFIKRKLKINIKRISSNLEIPEFNKKFDFIFCRNVLEHTLNPLSILYNNYRYLSKNGLFYTSTLNPQQDTYAGGRHLKGALQEAKSIEYINFYKNNLKEIDDISGLYHKKKKLFVFEGIIGSGKTTLINQLLGKVESSSKINIKSTKIFSKDMTNIDFDFRRGRYYTIFDELKYMLFDDSIVSYNFMERNYLSTLAHTYAKAILTNDDEEYSDMIKWYKQNINSTVYIPDAYIILDIPVNLVTERLTQRGQANVCNPLWNNKDYLNIVKDFYSKFTNENEVDSKVYIVDGTQKQDEVLKTVIKIINE